MKKGKKVTCDSFEDDKKNKLQKIIRKGQWINILDERSSIFDNVQVCSMTEPCIHTTPAFRLIKEDFKGAIQEDPTLWCFLEIQILKECYLIKGIKVSN